MQSRWILISVTRLGDLLDFGQLSKCVATISLHKSPTFLGSFCQGVKVKSFLGNFYWHLVIFLATLILTSQTGGRILRHDLFDFYLDINFINGLPRLVRAR